MHGLAFYDVKATGAGWTPPDPEGYVESPGHESGLPPMIDEETPDVTLTEADLDGVFPEGFYATTNFQTDVRINGAWLEVGDRRWTSASVSSASLRRARRGVPDASGEEGRPPRGRRLRRPCPASTPKRSGGRGVPLHVLGRLHRATEGAAHRRRGARDQGGPRCEKKVLFVGGPAIVHSGSATVLEGLIRGGSSTCSSPATRSPHTTSRHRCSARRSAIDLARGESVRTGTSTTSRHQPRPPRGLHRRGGPRGLVTERRHARMRDQADPVRPLPDRSATTGRCRTSSPTPSPPPTRCASRPPASGSRWSSRRTLHGVATGNMLPAGSSRSRRHRRRHRDQARRPRHHQAWASSPTASTSSASSGEP